MAYLVNVVKTAEDDASVEYTYSGSGYDCGAGKGRFHINKETGDVDTFPEEGAVTVEKLVDKGIMAVLKYWRQTGMYPAEAQWAA